jgi:hypothetical protein
MTIGWRFPASMSPERRTYPTMFRTLWISLLALTCCQPTLGAQPWYDVELIIFERPGVSSAQLLPEDTALPDVSGANPLSEASADPFTAYALLPRNQYQLDQAYRYLNASGGRFRPLLHVAWRQPAGTGPASPGVYLATAPGPGGQPRLEGTVRLSVSRYLHLDVDLLLNRLAPAATDMSPGIGYQGFRLKGHRRMRSGELHYIDHPVIGVLALVRPFRAAPATSQEPEDTTAAASPPAADDQPGTARPPDSDEATDIQ